MKNRKNILTYIVAALSILVTSASSSLGVRPHRLVPWHALPASSFSCDGRSGLPASSVTGNWN